MREIKFRAWKKTDTPEMFTDVAYIDFNKKELGINYRVSNQTARLDKEPLNNIILMQYTGLKDKNGKEIYEGDILKADSGEYYSNSYFTTEDEWEMVMQVKFKYSSFVMVCTEDEEIEIHLGETGWNEIELEVIGNIYENPELLEKEQSK